MKSLLRSSMPVTLRRLAAHGYQVDEQAAGDNGFWTQFNRRELRDLPVLGTWLAGTRTC